MNKNYIDEFLNYITSYYENHKPITMEEVYSKLVTFNLKPESVEPLFNIWIERFKTRPGIKVSRNPNYKKFCLFNNGKVENDSIKMYISLKKHNLDSNVTKIFDFIRSNNIIHESSVAMNIRGDLITIRVSKKEDVKLIADFVNNNKEIKKELNNVIPFAYNYNGVGLVKDGKYVYTLEISKQIAHCLNKGMKLNGSNFINYLSQISKNTNDKDLKLIYEVASTKINSLDELYDINEKTNDEKALYEIMDATYQKYDELQVKEAIINYINNGETRYFTRGIKYNLRDNLRKNLSSNDVLELVKKIGKSNNLDEMVQKFVNNRYADQISNKKEMQVQNENTYYESLKNIYIKEGYKALVQYVNKDYKTNKQLIDKILLLAYPNIDEKTILAYTSNDLVGYAISNLVKGYVDIQETNKTLEEYLKYIYKIYGKEKVVEELKLLLNNKKKYRFYTSEDILNECKNMLNNKVNNIENDVANLIALQVTNENKKEININTNLFKAFVSIYNDYGYEALIKYIDETIKGTKIIKNLSPELLKLEIKKIIKALDINDDEINEYIKNGSSPIIVANIVRQYSEAKKINQKQV